MLLIINDITNIKCNVYIFIYIYHSEFTYKYCRFTINKASDLH